MNSTKQLILDYMIVTNGPSKEVTSLEIVDAVAEIERRLSWWGKVKFFLGFGQGGVYNALRELADEGYLIRRETTVWEGGPERGFRPRVYYRLAGRV